MLLWFQKPLSLFLDECDSSEIFIKVLGEDIQSTSLMPLHNTSLLVDCCLSTHKKSPHDEFKVMN